MTAADWGGERIALGIHPKLVSAASAEYHLRGLQQDIQIEEDGLPSDVVDIEHNTSAVVSIIPAGYLPKSGDPRLGRQIAVQMAAISQQLLTDDRSRPYQAHFPPDDIPKLGKLIQAGTPKKASNSGDAGVVTEFMVTQPFRPELRMTFQKLPQCTVSVWNHAAELETIESFAVATDATVAKNDRTALPAKEYGNGEDQGCKYDTQEHCANDIQGSFQGITNRASWEGMMGFMAGRNRSNRINLLNNPKVLPRGPSAYPVNSL